MRSLCPILASAEDHLPLCVALAEETWRMRSLCLDLASAEDHLPLCADLAEETWEDEEFMSGLSFSRRSSATLCRPCRGDMGG